MHLKIFLVLETDSILYIQQIIMLMVSILVTSTKITREDSVIV